MFFQKIPNFAIFNNIEVPILKLFEITLKIASKNQLFWAIEFKVMKPILFRYLYSYGTPTKISFFSSMVAKEINRAENSYDLGTFSLVVNILLRLTFSKHKRVAYQNVRNLI